MNAFEKLEALGNSAGEATKTVDIVLGEKTEKITLRRLSFEEAQTITSSIFAEDAEGNFKPDRNLFKERNALLIALSVVGEDGTQVTVDQAKKLHPKIGMQLLKAANEFNGFNEKAVEN